MPKMYRLDQVNQFVAITLQDGGHDPAATTVPQCMLVRWNFGLADGKPGHVMTHARYVGPFPGTVALANSLDTSLKTLFATNLTAFMPVGASIQGVTIRDINVADQPFIDSSNGPMNASDATGALPDETAVVLTLRTVLTGPGNRGRIYLPAWGFAASDPAGVINTAAMTALQEFANGVQGMYSAQALIMCLALYHRLAYTGTNGRPHAERLARTQDITSITVRDNHWDSQRRRGLR